MVLSVVKNGVSEETISALKCLLAEAQAGTLVGIAYAAMTKTGFHSGFAGNVKNSPIFTRGMLRCLDDDLAKLVLPK